MSTDAREPVSFRELPSETLECYRRYLVRRLSRRHRPEDAEDMAQDVLLRAVSKGSLPNPIVFLNIGARWASINFVRVAIRRDLGCRVDPESVLDGYEPFAQIEQSDLCEALQRALGRLTPDLFETVWRRMEGESVATIARNMECSEQTVRNRREEALRQLRLTLADGAD